MLRELQGFVDDEKLVVILIVSTLCSRGYIKTDYLIGFNVWMNTIVSGTVYKEYKSGR